MMPRPAATARSRSSSARLAIATGTSLHDRSERTSSSNREPGALARQRADVDEHRRVQEELGQLGDLDAQVPLDDSQVQAAQAQHGQGRHGALEIERGGAARAAGRGAPSTLVFGGCVK